MAKKAAPKKKTARKAPARKAAPKSKRNAPSLVGSLAQAYVPLTDMERMAKGAQADLARVGRAIAGKRRGRRNPGEQAAAADLYERFHGRPSDEVLTVVEPEVIRTDFAELGDLQAIHFKSLTGFKVVLKFEGVKLTSAPDGRQLYFIGGDQTVELGKFDMGSDEWIRDRMVLGQAGKIIYRAEKAFDNFETIDYWHRLGEESKRLPTLMYDTLNRRLSLAGGRYEVRPEGIVD